MLSMWRLVLAVGLVGFHTVRGDFGIPPVITGAASIHQYATSIVDQATAIENAYSDIVTDGNVPQFNEAGVALKAVYQQIVNLVRPIGQSLGALATNKVGPVETVFGDTDTKIVAMQTFITNDAPGLLATVETKVSVYVKNELNDIITMIRNTLAGLKSSLTSLRAGVINARTAAAANGGVYTNSIVQNNVKSSMITAVQTASLSLQGDLPSAQLSAVESARTIYAANEFINVGMTKASGDSVNEFWESDLFDDYQRIMEFRANLEALVAAELPLVTERLGQFAAGFSALVDPLGTQYDTVSSVFDQIVDGTELNVLNGYKTLVSSVHTFMANMIERFYPPIEPVIHRLAEVIIERSPYADYCYEMYYPKVDAYLNSGEMTMISCLDIELGRENALMESLLEVVYELQFFLEDTNAYLNICYRLSLFDTDLANECLQEHTDFSEIIPCTAIQEYATLLQLLCKEVDSIRFRLWTCMSRDTLQFPFEAAQLMLEIETCRLNGPFSPA